MTVQQMIRSLGGPSALGRAIGCTASAVSHWGRLGEVPREHHLTLWRMALDAGVAWEPPGADAIRAQLANQPSSEAA